MKTKDTETFQFHKIQICLNWYVIRQIGYWLMTCSWIFTWFDLQSWCWCLYGLELIWITQYWFCPLKHLPYGYMNLYPLSRDWVWWKVGALSHGVETEKISRDERSYTMIQWSYWWVTYSKAVVWLPLWARACINEPYCMAHFSLSLNNIARSSEMQNHIHTICYAIHPERSQFK